MSANLSSLALSDVLARGDVWRGNRLAEPGGEVVSSGHAGLDTELPGGGWPLGNLTEILVDRSGIGEIGLLLPALRQLSAANGWLALVAPPWLPHAPAWTAAGIATERLLVVQPGKQGAWCIEQLLKSGGFAGVLAWPEAGIDARVLRRLQVAAEGQRVLAVLWRSTATAASPSPAPLRLALAAASDGLVLRILKRRGRPASRPLPIDIPRPGSHTRVMAGPAFPSLAAGSTAAVAVA